MSSSMTRRRIASTMLLSCVAITHRGAGAVDPLEQAHDALAGVGVEVAGRLVGEQHQRPVDERPGDRDALLLTAGQLVSACRLALPSSPTRSSTSGTVRWIARCDLLITSRAKATLS